MHRPSITTLSAPATWVSAIGSVVLSASGVAADATTQDLHLAPGLRAVSLAESGTVIHPIALDWSSDGFLWIAENSPATAPTDTPGRIVRLEDTDKDGRYDQRHLFLAGLSAVTSVLDWPPGILIAAAPDLLYAEDRDADGQADAVRRILVGFDDSSIPRRFNSLCLGLDGLVYAANGLAGGRVQVLQALTPDSQPPPMSLINLDDSDFRFAPATGQIEAVAGLTWAGRTRDDLGSWFGLDPDLNVVQMLLPRHYTERNPAVAFPDPMVTMARLHVEDPEADEARSQCYIPPGDLEIFRAPRLGPVGRGDLLVANPSRRSLLHTSPKNDPFFALDPHTRARDLTVLAESTNRVFVPVQIRTGPDDSLWIVDLGSPVDSSGAARGRILQLQALDQRSPPLHLRLSLLRQDPLQALHSPNGTLRDMAQRILTSDTHADLAASLPVLATNSLAETAESTDPADPYAVHVQALWILRQLNALSPTHLEQALLSDHDPVKIQGLRLSEHALRNGFLPEVLSTLAEDPNPAVRYQAALSLGYSPHVRAPALLARLATHDEDHPWMCAAVLSSVGVQPLAFLDAWLALRGTRSVTSGTERLANGLVRTLVAAVTPQAVAEIIVRYDSDTALLCTACLLSATPRPSTPRSDILDPQWVGVLRPLLDRARLEIAARPLSDAERELRLPLLGCQRAHESADWDRLLHHANRGNTVATRNTALQALLRSSQPAVVHRLLDAWTTLRPSLRPRILAACLERSTWTPPLLQALESRVVAATELSPANRARLRQHPDPKIRQAATQLLHAQLPEPRAPALQDALQALPREGNPAQGKPIFQDLCAMCHAPPPPLRPIGPDLATIGSRTPDELLRAMLDPNAMIEPAHRTYFIETRDDEPLTGLLQEETDHSLHLLQVGGSLKEVAWEEVREIRTSNLSLMPEGLEGGLPPARLADLLAYLRSLQ